MSLSFYSKGILEAPLSLSVGWPPQLHHHTPPATPSLTVISQSMLYPIVALCQISVCYTIACDTC